jgi:hypothetical protein
MHKCSYCYNNGAWKKPVDLDAAKPWLDRINQYYHYKYNNPLDQMEVNIMVYKALTIWNYYNKE